jgi:UDP-N-acetyl-D-mannosaminuronic acid transferase (WecB/TagA/CpsF family)
MGPALQTAIAAERGVDGGFAFEVNTGTKPDAPPWMQRLRLTWVFPLAS